MPRRRRAAASGGTGRRDLLSALGHATPHPQEALRTALSTIGRLGPYAVQDKLRKAQGLLYEAERRDLDPERMRVAAAIIRQAGDALMKVAAGLRKSLRSYPVEAQGAPGGRLERRRQTSKTVE